MLLGCQNPAETLESDRPNIILLLADDLGYNDLSVYRANHADTSSQVPTCQTPHLDQLAEQGIRFTQFYCGAAVCSPSRAALLTGRNATRVGIYNWIPGNNPMHLRDSEVTLAEMLNTAGYRSGHFGKWHLTSEGMEQPLPMHQGFEHAFYAYNNAKPSHENPVNYFRNGNAVGPMQGYACHLVVEEALGWLDTVQSSGKPFYANIWFNEPHEKVAAPDSLKNRHDYQQAYYGAIENMDLAIGRVMQYLQDKGIANNTIVLFASDNGSQVLGSNDPLRGEKCYNYEGGIRSPFMVRWPGKIKPGQQSSAPGSFVDILPTLAEITGAGTPDRKLDGRSLSAVLQGTQSVPNQKQPIFFFRYFHDPAIMMRAGDWVLLGYYHTPLPYEENYNQQQTANLKPGPGAPRWSMWGFQPAHQTFMQEQRIQFFELYNIIEDPAQKRDLSGDYPGRLERMKRRAMELKREMLSEGGNWYETDG